MPRFPLRAAALALLVLLPALPLAFLCRGRTPTRFEFKNLSAWERQASAAAAAHSHAPHKHGILRATAKRKVRAIT